MIQTKGYAAQTVESDMAPWNFERRDVGPDDVQLEIIYPERLVSRYLSHGSWS